MAATWSRVTHLAAKTKSAGSATPQVTIKGRAAIVVILVSFETLPEFMRRFLVLCLMCLLPLQLLADGFHFPVSVQAPAQATAAENTASCSPSVFTDDADLPMASVDLSALTGPTFSCLRSIAATTSVPGYVPVVQRDLFFPVPKPPPR